MKSKTLGLLLLGGTSLLLLAFGEEAIKVRPPDLQITPAIGPITRTSTIVIPVDIAFARIKFELEAAVPRGERGSRGNPIGDPVIEDVIEWNFNRSDIGLTGSGSTLTATTEVGGTVRVRGVAQLIRGGLGKILGKINPTRVPFSAHADLRATAWVSVTPQIAPNWRIAPKIAMSAQVSEARIPILDITAISVRGEIQPKLDQKIAEFRAKLEERIRNDPFLQKEAQRVWNDICQAFPLSKEPDGSQRLWLQVRPTAASAAQPRVADGDKLRLAIGLRAETVVTTSDRQPDCPFPETLELVPPPEHGFLALAVPVRLTFDEASKLLTDQLKGKIFPDEGAVKLTLSDLRVKPSGERLLFEADISGREDIFFGTTITGTLYLWGKPDLDRATQKLRFTDVRATIESAAAFGLAGVVGKAAAPAVEKYILSRATIDLGTELEKAKRRANEAIAAFQSKDVGISAKINEIGLSEVAFGADGIQITIEANGTVRATIP